MGFVKNFKKSMKFNKKTAYIMSIGVVLAVIVGYLDAYAVSQIWERIGGLGGETYLTVEPFYLSLFWWFATLAILLGALSWYFASKRDLSEAFAVFIGLFLVIKSGLTDVFYYMFRQIPLLSDELPWLNFSTAGTFTRLVEHPVVLGTDLIINVIIFLTIAVLVTNWLVNQKKW